MKIERQTGPRYDAAIDAGNRALSRALIEINRRTQLHPMSAAVLLLDLLTEALASYDRDAARTFVLSTPDALQDGPGRDAANAARMEAFATLTRAYTLSITPPEGSG